MMKNTMAKTTKSPLQVFSQWAYLKSLAACRPRQVRQEAGGGRAGAGPAGRPASQARSSGHGQRGRSRVGWSTPPPLPSKAGGCGTRAQSDPGPVPAGKAGRQLEGVPPGSCAAASADSARDRPGISCTRAACVLCPRVTGPTPGAAAPPHPTPRSLDSVGCSGCWDLPPHSDLARMLWASGRLPLASGQEQLLSWPPGTPPKHCASQPSACRRTLPRPSPGPPTPAKRCQALNLPCRPASEGQQLAKAASPREHRLEAPPRGRGGRRTIAPPSPVVHGPGRQAPLRAWQVLLAG